MKKVIVEIEDLIPHGKQAKFVDEIQEFSNEVITSKGRIPYKQAVDSNGMVETIFAIEFAAQTAGIMIGLEKKKEGKNHGKERGFIVSLKKIKCLSPHFPAGNKIVTKIQKISCRSSYWTFNFQIYHKEKQILFGKLGIFSPD